MVAHKAHEIILVQASKCPTSCVRGGEFVFLYSRALLPYKRGTRKLVCAHVKKDCGVPRAEPLWVERARLALQFQGIGTRRRKRLKESLDVNEFYVDGRCSHVHLVACGPHGGPLCCGSFLRCVGLLRPIEHAMNNASWLVINNFIMLLLQFLTMEKSFFMVISAF